MKFVAVIRQVPDSESKLKIDSSKVDLSSATLILDQMDEYAVEEIIRLQEKHGGESIVVALGPERFEEAVRTALAMGADRAIHIIQDSYTDPVTQGEALAEALKAEAPEVILTGGQQADWDSQALGATTAEALGWPVITWTTMLEIEGGSAKAKHDLDEGAELVRVQLPAVFTTQQGLNEPRYPTLPGIMKAKRKEIKKVNLSATSKVEVTEQTIQERSRLNRMLDGSKDPAGAAGELVKLLHEEAKVI